MKSETAFCRNQKKRNRTFISEENMVVVLKVHDRWDGNCRTVTDGKNYYIIYYDIYYDGLRKYHKSSDGKYVFSEEDEPIKKKGYTFYISERSEFSLNLIDIELLEDSFICPKLVAKIGNKFVFCVYLFSNNVSQSKLEYKEKLTNHEVMRRAEYFKQLTRSNKIADLPELFNMSYIWDPEAEDRVISSSKPFIKLIGTYPSFHSYGYYGLFKPSVSEAVQHLPNELFIIPNKYLITTKMYSSDPGELIIEDYHLGETFVYEYKTD